MDKFLKILFLEDSELDVELARYHLTKSGMKYEMRVANTRDEFIYSLDNFSPDIVLSDHTLPQFNSFGALKIVKEKNLKIPFILLTGSVSEEFAVDIIKKGANDYILKGSMVRLPSAIISSLEKCNFENERQRYIDEIISNEALLREAEQLALLGSFWVNLITNEVKWSEELYRILNYPVGGIQPSFDFFLNCVHPEDVDFVKRSIEDCLKELNSTSINFRIKPDKETVKHIHSELVVKRDLNNVPITLIGVNRDVTKDKLAEIEREKMLKDIVQRNKDLEQFAYIVSHNLRGPVANILGYSGILNDDTFSEEDKIDMISGISASVLKLDDVIIDLNQILQVRHSIHEHKERIIFSELSENVQHSIMSLFVNKDIEMKTDFSEIKETMSIKSYFYSIFYNLITNSIKYRRTGIPLCIEIESKDHPDKFELIFKDNGSGIDLEKNKESLFGLYKRFHPEIDGKGMGLFMVRAQVESLGGKIHIQSKINEGTKFTIEFEK